MIINATFNEKQLVESNSLNSIVTVGQDNTISFEFNGLFINLVTNIFNAEEECENGIFAKVENGKIIIIQSYPLCSNPLQQPMRQGMLIPYEVGKRPDGKRIYISWHSEVFRAGDGTLVMSTSYSFYVDL